MSEATTFEGNGITVKVLDPKNVTPEECLEIAKCGATAWNSWQKTHHNKIVIPENTKIPEQINFSGFQFSSQIEFQKVTFETSNNCCFENATFNKSVQFNDCIFKKIVNFRNAKIPRPIVFCNSIFEEDFDISNSVCGSFFIFTDSTFLKKSYFKNLKARGIEHKRSKFKDLVDFSNSTFSAGGELSSFQKCTFCKEAKFSTVIFEDQAVFHDTIFELNADFSSVKFYKDANFRGTKFIGNAYFKEAKFIGKAIFTYAQFGKFVNFNKAEFSELANFRLAQFISADPLPHEDNATTINFSGAYFASKALFDIGQWNHLRPIYRDDYDDRKKWADGIGVSTDKFSSIDFSGAKFNGKTSFQGRKFIGETNFGPCIKENIESVTEFSNAPNFHECEFHQNTTFYKARFPEAIGSDEAARAYRTLKLVFQKKYDLRQEQQFYRLEIQEEAKLEKSKVKKITFWMYQFFSGYGFNICQPFFWLIFIAHIIATSIYGYDSNLVLCCPTHTDCNSLSTLLQFSLLGIPGFERIGAEATKTLFSEGIIPPLTFITIILHKLSIVTGLFLIGLALRNLFKMK